MKLIGKIFLVVAVMFVVGCQSINRPFVVTNPTQMGDLYWHGELTDSQENRWRVYILPGMKPMFETGKEGWVDAGDYLAEYSRKRYWEDFGQLAKDSWEFSGDSAEFTYEDVIVDYWLDGIGQDAGEASHNIAENFRQAPFGWIPRIIGNALWGYVILPVGRTATMPIGLAAGATGTVLGAAGVVVLPVGYFFYPPVAAIGSAIVPGTLVPIAGITAHQLAYILVLPNREPAPEFDGRFGLSIINGKDGNYNDVKEYSSVEYLSKDEEEHLSDGSEGLIEDGEGLDLLPGDDGELLPRDDDGELFSEMPTVDLKYIRKVLVEYVLVQKAKAEYFAKVKDVKELRQNLHLGISRFQVDSEAMEYRTSGKLYEEFSELWETMKGKLAPNAVVPNKKAAFQEFVELVYSP